MVSEWLEERPAWAGYNRSDRLRRKSDSVIKHGPVEDRTLQIEHQTSNFKHSMTLDPDPLPVGHAGIDARLKKGPTVHPTAWIVPGAAVIGDVTLEEESSVWYGAVLRGDINRIVIGPRSNIQDNAVVHIDTPNETRLGELVTVGHSAIVHACKIDNEVLVGMGAIILDDVEVGARSIIGANALVTLGTKIPPGSLA